MPGASADRCRKLIPCLHPLRMDPITLHFNIFQARMTARGVPGGMGRESPGAEFMLGNLVLCHSKFQDIYATMLLHAFTGKYVQFSPEFFNFHPRQASKKASQPATDPASQPQPATASKQASQPKRTLNIHVKPTLSNA